MHVLNCNFFSVGNELGSFVFHALDVEESCHRKTLICFVTFIEVLRTFIQALFFGEAFGIALQAFNIFGRYSELAFGTSWMAVAPFHFCIIPQILATCRHTNLIIKIEHSLWTFGGITNF